MLIESLLRGQGISKCLFAFKLEIVLLIKELRRLDVNRDALPDYYKQLYREVWLRLGRLESHLPSNVLTDGGQRLLDGIFNNHIIDNDFHLNTLQCLIMLDPVFDTVVNKSVMRPINQMPDHHTHYLMIALKKSEMLKVLKVMFYDDLSGESDLLAEIAEITSDKNDPAAMYERLGEVIIDEPDYNVYHAIRAITDYLELSRAEVAHLTKDNILFSPGQLEPLSRLFYANTNCRLQRYNIVNNYYAFVYMAIQLNKLIGIYDNNAEKIDTFLKEQKDSKYKLIVQNWGRSIFSDGLDEYRKKNKKSFSEFMVERQGRPTPTATLHATRLGAENGMDDFERVVFGGEDVADTPEEIVTEATEERGTPFPDHDQNPPAEAPTDWVQVHINTRAMTANATVNNLWDRWETAAMEPEHNYDEPEYDETVYDEYDDFNEETLEAAVERERQRIHDIPRGFRPDRIAAVPVDPDQMTVGQMIAQRAQRGPSPMAQAATMLMEAREEVEVPEYSPLEMIMERNTPVQATALDMEALRAQVQAIEVARNTMEYVDTRGYRHVLPVGAEEVTLVDERGNRHRIDTRNSGVPAFYHGLNRGRF